MYKVDNNLPYLLWIPEEQYNTTDLPTLIEADINRRLDKKIESFTLG